MKVNICNQSGVVFHSYDFSKAVGEVIPTEVYDELAGIQAKLDRSMRKVFIPASVAAGVLSIAKTALAATAGAADIAAKLTPLIHMVQNLALPVGIGIATWGMIELMIGNPAGKQKVKMAILGYVGIFLIPQVFEMIHDAFQ